MNYIRSIARWISYLLIGVGVLFEGLTGLLSSLIVDLGIRGEWFFILFIPFVIYNIISFRSSRFHTSFLKESFVFLRVFFISYGLFIVFFFISFLVFVSYYTSHPGYLSDITLSNGNQRVTFLQMSHIATDTFYRDKHESIKKLSEGNVVFLIEGVGTGSKENEDRFNQSLGFKFDNNLYPTMARITGLSVQSGSVLFDGIQREKLINIDMNIDEIVGLLPPIASISGALTPPLTHLDGEVQMLESLSQSENKFLEYTLRAFLNWSIIYTAEIDRITLIDKNELYDIIIGKRNQKIVDYIVANPDKDIVIVYGALHYPGIMQSLVYHDKNWKIENYTNHAPYSD